MIVLNNASKPKIFSKKFFHQGVSLMGVCPPPGSHVGMAHVLMSLLPYIIPPCGRATCRGEHITLPPRGAYWSVMLVT